MIDNVNYSAIDARLDELKNEIKKLEKSKDNAYTERNKLVLFLTYFILGVKVSYCFTNSKTSCVELSSEIMTSNSTCC